MTDISKHPLLRQSYEVCIAIEHCGASPQLTEAVTKASDLLKSLDDYLTVDLDAADFSDALMWLKEGKRVARAGWNAGGQWAAMRFAQADKLIGFEDDEQLYQEGDGFILKNAQNVLVPWVPSVGDLLATDWQVVKA